ncbi:MATE efflux family protein 4, chloroplastic [Dendrobium catenatum]|uniref:MATE efflux family protein 4, chloroplastic n=1 Tax=Dendrobium catenatum TaxID=906689 RepID=A0A2I0X8W8_9ASPA|nr:MATE efflux family protein 4, chloroplastic [Dendrobium catenatum]
MKDIVMFAGPATGLWISGPLMSLIDTMVIGQGSSLELAALGPQGRRVYYGVGEDQTQKLDNNFRGQCFGAKSNIYAAIYCIYFWLGNVSIHKTFWFADINRNAFKSFLHCVLSAFFLSHATYSLSDTTICQTFAIFRNTPAHL